MDGKCRRKQNRSSTGTVANVRTGTKIDPSPDPIDREHCERIEETLEEKPAQQAKKQKAFKIQSHQLERKQKLMSEAAMKTDTSIATDKNTTVTSDTSVSSMRPLASGDDDQSLESHSELDDFAPPLRIKATRVPERLSASSLTVPAQVEKSFRRKSSSNNSGTRSPLSGSSISSLEDAGIDTDILTDKMGTLELDASCSKMNHSGTNLHLQTVAERLSEETLEDCHAFTELKSMSRGNSITTGGEVASNLLEPLDEEDEYETEGQVKITNMGEILEATDEEVAEASTPSSP
eukprot:scaffold22635_cov134-Cylindrotheca_fusiformis.AAC.5